MASVTVRDIPDDVLEKLRILSLTDRRSLNGEILMVLETGMQYYLERKGAALDIPLSKATQVELWGSLAGKWEDERNLEEIVTDIYQARTEGRDVTL